MATAHPPGEHAHHGPTFQLYMTVAAILAVFTGLSFVFNWMAREHHISVETSFVLILGVAVCKAVLVGLFFMHLLLSERVTWLVVCVAVMWVGILFVLTLNDYWSRGAIPFMPGH